LPFKISFLIFESLKKTGSLSCIIFWEFSRTNCSIFSINCFAIVIMSIFDCHLHFFSRDFFAAMVRPKNPAAEVDAVLHELSERKKIEIPPNNVQAHLQRWLAELDRYGVEHAIMFASLPEEAMAVAEAIKHSDGRLVGFCMMDPAQEGAVHRVHKLASDCGYRGIMLFPALHHYHLFEASLLPFFEAVAQCRTNVLTHFAILQVKLRDALGLPRVKDILEEQKQAMVQAGFSAAELEMILRGNAWRLFEK
jgi:hypothetical protein